MLLVTQLQAGPGGASGAGQGNGCSPSFLCAAAGKKGERMPMGAAPSLFSAVAAGPQKCCVLA